jgi:hypothetical protein
VVKIRLLTLGAVFGLFAGCGAGLPPEEPSQGTTVPPAGCAVVGGPLEFLVDSNATTIFWAANSRINPTDPAVDQSLIKLSFEVPANQLPTGVTTARIRVRPVLNATLPQGGHIDTAFEISAVEPPDLGQFSGGDQAALTLRIRYDPVLCEVPSDVESTLVLGRYNSTSATWQDVCRGPQLRYFRGDQEGGQRLQRPHATDVPQQGWLHVDQPESLRHLCAAVHRPRVGTGVG